MTRRWRSVFILDEFFDLTDIPSGDQIASRVWIMSDGIEYILHLIDDISFFCLPSPPLLAVDRTKISPLQGKIYIGFDLLDEYKELSIPLWTIARKILIFSGFFEIFGKCPFIPDFDVVLNEISDIRITGDEPDEFMNNSADKYFFSRQEREALRKIESHLVSKNRPSTHTGTIHPINSGIHDFLKQIEILLFWMHI